MRLFGFRPTLWPTVITLSAVTLSVGLGAWQIQRHFWKSNLITYRRAQAAKPVIPRPRNFVRRAHEFRRVRVSGTLMHDKEMYLAARSRRGNAGYHIITPLRLADRSYILVNRGWVPLNRRKPATRPAGQVGGVLTIEGIMRLPPEQGWFVPDNRPDRNLWFFVDIVAMADHARLVKVWPYIVEAGPSPNPGGYPVGGQTRLKLSSNHLLYAVQWFFLALAAGAIYLLYHRRRQ